MLWEAFADELIKISAVKTELKPHQQRVVDRVQREDQPGLVVAHGLGSGKTLTAIAAQDVLGMPATVVVPAALQANYLKELDKHLEGTSPEAALTTLQRVSKAGRLGASNPLLVVDEAHRAREVNTKTYQALKNSIPGTEKRLLLTASPFYNRPSDIAPLVNLAAGEKVLPADPTEFKSRYIRERKVQPGFIARVRGVKPGVVEEVDPFRAPELRTVFRKWVDYHPSSTEGFPSVQRKTVEVPMTQSQLRAYDAMMGTAPYWVAAKVKAGLPPDKKEAQQLNAFVNAVRQISNTTRAFAPNKAPEEPKIDAAYKRLQSTLTSTPTARAVVYSNYLKSGIEPYKERLDRAGIPYGEFTGEMKRREREQLVRDYNDGKKKVLLLSSAGGEGLDLKGTRLIQILEPHWNAEKLKQVEGRGIRFGSHAHLPEEQRNVVVENYLATRPERKGMARVLMGRSTGGSVDQYLTGMSDRKEGLVQQMKLLLPTETAG